ncbi:hypothetical protein HBH51_131060 [Parastagonospora nodorum]|nr:hypothetical protein HBH51_131060 [Parastagonospora nodorum]
MSTMATENIDPTALTKTFHWSFQTTQRTHHYNIKWCSFGCIGRQQVILIHGTPWSSRVWKPLALALARHYHVFLFDNPGFGDPPPEEEVYGESDSSRTEVERLDANLERQSRAFAALYKEWDNLHGNWKPHVIAHDHGGLMALRAFSIHACQFASLCLIDVVAIGPFGQPLFKTVAENPQIFENLPDSVFEGILESYIRDAAFKDLSPETMEMLKERWKYEDGKVAFVRQLCQANSRTTEDVEHHYWSIGSEIPVQIIWGEQDQWIPVETAERLAMALNAKRVVRIEDAGHLIMYDQPEALATELANWLVSVKPRPLANLLAAPSD